MNKLEALEKMVELEELKIKQQNILADMDSYYFEKAIVTVVIQTKDFNKKTDDVTIMPVDKNLYRNYLEEEIFKIDREYEKLLEKLKGDN